MEFTFYLAVKNPMQLQKEIIETLELWWPEAEWEHNVSSITQILTEQTEDPELKDAISFVIIAEINKNHLKNSLCKRSDIC